MEKLKNALIWVKNNRLRLAKAATAAIVAPVMLVVCGALLVGVGVLILTVSAGGLIWGPKKAFEKNKWPWESYDDKEDEEDSCEGCACKKC